MTIIRDCEVTDIPAVAKMCASAGWGCIGNEVDLYRYLSRGYMKCVVAESRGELTGFITLNLAEYWGRRATIDAMYVVPHRRGTMTLFIMIREAWRRLRDTGWHRVAAFVDETNTWMVGFVRKLGWREEALLEGYGPGGENCFMFSRRTSEGFMRRSRDEILGNAKG